MPFLRVDKRQRRIDPEEWIVDPQAAENDLRAVLYRGPRGQVFVRGVVIGGEDMDEKSSWMRVVVSIAIDWRFVVAVVLLVLALLLK